MVASYEQRSAIRVLIVEDNDAQRQVLTDLIRDEGFIPVPCSNAFAALARANEHVFGVAILDQRLPEMSGTTLLERLCVMQRGMQAIIHTAYGSFESARDAVNLGAFAYVEKLGHPDELVRQVHRAAQAWMAGALQRSEEKYRQLVDSVQAIVWRSDPLTARFRFVSREAEKLLGYSVKQWLTEPAFWQNHIHPDDRAWVLERCMQATTTLQALEFEYRMTAADGRVVWLHDFVNIIVEAGQPVELVGVMIDVTKRKQTEAALKKSEESFRLMFAHNPLPMWVYDRETFTFLDVNQAALAKYGYTREEFLSMKMEDIRPEEDIPRFREYISATLPATEKVTEWKHKKKDGTLIDVEKTAHDFSYRGRPGRLVLANDVTERKRLQKEILEISNREQRRIGQDLHDGLGQLLTGIGFRIAALEGDLQEMALPLAADAAEVVQMVQRAIAQTRVLAHGLDPVNVERQGLATALRALATATESIYGIACTFTCPQPVLIQDLEVAAQVYRIAQEALTNAIRHAQPARLDVSLTVQDTWVVLTVRDDGIGITTTNPRREGMGLRIMDYRARMIGGTFDVRPGPERGTVVTCRFLPTSIQQLAE